MHEFVSSSSANPTNVQPTEGESNHQVHGKEHQCHQDSIVKTWGRIVGEEPGLSNQTFLPLEEEKLPENKFRLSFL